MKSGQRKVGLIALEKLVPRTYRFFCHPAVGNQFPINAFNICMQICPNVKKVRVQNVISRCYGRWKAADVPAIENVTMGVK